MLRRNALVILILSAVVAHLPCSYAQESKSGSLTTQDYIDIQQLYAQYNYAIDAGDVEAYVALFVPEGSFNKFVGHDGLRTFMKNRTAGNRRHWNTNLVITPTPEGAKGAVYLMFVDVGLKPPAITGAGKYEDTLIKTSERWRFSKRVQATIHESKMGIKLGDTFWGMCTLINPLDWSQNSTAILQAASRADLSN